MEKLGRYRITGELGRGAGGVVYRAVDSESGEECALKALPASGFGSTHDTTMIERLKREAESTAVLKHPNIVRVRGLDEDNGQVFLVMELVRGRTLEEALRKGESFAPGEVARMISMVASALDFAHQANMVHRDVKPANLMLTESGDLKVMDFGAVKMLDRANSMNLTTMGTAVGSPYYMSPEQVNGKTVEGRSDQFALAVIAYQLLAGRRPFEAEAMAAVLFQIAGEKHPPLTSFKQDLPPAIEPVFDRALAKTPAGRYASCSEFAAELSAVFKTPRNRNLIIAAAIGVVILAIAIFLFLKMK